MSIACISGHMPRYNTQKKEDSSFEYIFLVEVHLYKLINKSNTLSIWTLIFSGKLAPWLLLTLAMKNPTSIGHTTLYIEMPRFHPAIYTTLLLRIDIIYVSAISKQL